MFPRATTERRAGERVLHGPEPRSTELGIRTLTSIVTSLEQPSIRAIEPGFRSYGRKGTLEVRLAVTPREIDAAQALRYRVFYEEMSATADAETRLRRRDVDLFDEFCDHLLVLDHALGRGEETPLESVVGCYRLLRQDVAQRHSGFYTAGEYDVASLITLADPSLRFVELGRSCVLPAYRTRPTVELLWHGIMSYVAEHGLDVMLGCASFEGTDPEKLAVPLSYLHHYHSAPPAWHVRAREERYVDMNRIPQELISARDAVRLLPPVIKGYLRAGCYIGDGAVVDEQFGTIDVLILCPVSQITERYSSKFDPRVTAQG